MGPIEHPLSKSDDEGIREEHPFLGVLVGAALNLVCVRTPFRNLELSPVSPPTLQSESLSVWAARSLGGFQNGALRTKEVMLPGEILRASRLLASAMSGRVESLTGHRSPFQKHQGDFVTRHTRWNESRAQYEGSSATAQQIRYT